MSIIKHRKIELGHYNDFANVEKYKDVLSQQLGVQEVTADPRKGVLEITYDLELTNLKTLEELLSHAGLVLPTTIWAKLKRGLIHFAEENELDNAHAPASPCCSHPDEILAKSKNS